MNTALLLIDVQESFRHRPFWSERDLPEFLTHTHALIDGCLASGIPIVRIWHTGSDHAFSLDSGLVRPLHGLMAFNATAEFYKSRHSALVGTGLSVWLRERNIQRLIIAGIRTEQCCETTARHACDEGFEVSFVPEATLTFDMQHPDGTPLHSRDIVARTVAVLHGRFAAVRRVEQALARAKQ